MRFLTLLAAAVFLVSCSGLPVPGPLAAGPSSNQARAVLKGAALKQGDPWKRYGKVQVSYSGKWSVLATRLQPVLTDPGFRGSSVETYQPRLARVAQTHTGPSGTKVVVRQAQRVDVAFNGVRTSNAEIKDSSALVADAYTIFLFGPSWLTAHARDLRLLKDQKLSGQSCQLVAGRLAPGIGRSTEDYFIAWIGRESGLMERFQFTLNGLESTRGADVDVIFSEFWKAADGSIWPAHFVERIQRPVLAQAHEWRMTALQLDGVQMK